MKMRKLLGVFLALSLLGGLSSAQAVTAVWLEPVYQEVGSGDTVQLTLHMSFTDQRTLGGGFDLTYDSNILSFVSFEFDSLFNCGGCPSDPAFASTGDGSTAGIVSSIGVANFGGIMGTYLMGTFTFAADGDLGLALLTMADNFLPYGPWIDFDTGATMAVEYGSAEVLVTPLPAAAWLMMAGLGFLVSFGRRKMGVSA